MSETRKALSIYFVFWLTGIVLAAGATLWFGLDARVPSDAAGLSWVWLDARVPVDFAADGTVTKSRSVAVLWIMPGMLTLLYGAMALAAWIDARRWRGKTIEFGEDALRALVRYGRTIRNYMIGFSVLAILVQLFGIARAAEVVTPLGLDAKDMVRAFNILAGLLFAYVGNVTPKIPYVQNPAVDAARHHRSNRFAGWVFTIGGIAYSLNGLFAPFDAMGPIAGMLIAAILLLPVLAYVWARISYRHQKRWEQHEGLV